MTKGKTLKQRLIAAVLVLVMMFTSLIGTTFAWFTDEVTSAGNKIVSGSLKIDLRHEVKKDEWVSVKNNSTHLIFNYDNWEPGFTTVETLEIVNLGNLALQYRLSIELEDGTAILGENGENLANVIDVYTVYGNEAASSYDDITKTGSKWVHEGTLADVLRSPSSFIGGQLLPTGETLKGGEAATTAVRAQTVRVALHMQESAGNGYQGLSVGNIYVNLIATQWSYESDSFDNSYDNGATFPTFKGDYVATEKVELNADNTVKSDVSLSSKEGEVSATVPSGALLESGTDEVTLTVSSLDETASNVQVKEDQVLNALDVHVSGVAAGNTKPILVTVKELLAKGLNMGNYELYHVEDGSTVKMTYVQNSADLDAHNEFTYDPATGDVVMALCSFSEITLLADTENAWEGGYDDSWYNADATELTIANADQLAALSAIVGGMKFTVINGDGEVENKQHDADSFAGKTVKLVADINLGDKETENNPDIIFYPIGYYNSTGSYEKTSGGSVTSNVHSFEGTFDGNGNTIANFYQNTWEMFGDYNSGYSGTPNHYCDAMGLFGYVVNGKVMNLTVDNFSSDGEFTPTGVIAAYAVNSTFENIAITNCNPRVYNTGNGGIVGIGGNSDDPDAYKLTFTNITIDNSNIITALWGSWDVACGGLVGMFRGDGHAHMTNCHVAAQMDVYNDVCGNYQYYWYRYSGMMIGTNKNMKTDENGYTVPETDKFHAENCTVHFGDWNDYYYCELVANSLASYTHDHQFSRLTEIQNVSEIQDENGNWNKTGNFLLISGDTKTCYHIVKNSDGSLKQHLHTDAGEETVNGETVLKEDKQIVYLPFNQLFTGYGWGVKHIPVYNGENYAFEGITILDREVADSVEKFESNFNGDYLHKVGNLNKVNVGNLFKELEGTSVVDSGVWVKIEAIDKNVPVSGMFEANTSDWTKGTIKFEGQGLVKITIQDYNFCTSTELILEVIEAKNYPTADTTVGLDATSNNVVLLSNIGSGFTVSGRYTLYGNGFTLNYTGNGQYLNSGLKQGVVTVSENGTLDNLRIVAPIYPMAYMYYGTAALGTPVQKGPYSQETASDGTVKTRYHYQLSAVAASGNATISNCYVYGGRNNIFVNTGDVTIKDTVLECGVVANVQIQSNESHTITLENVTTIQYLVDSNVTGTTSVKMMGAGVIVGPETPTNPKIILNGEFKQYNWVTADDKDAVSDEAAKKIIEAAVKATAYNHTINGKVVSNLGIIYMNEYATDVVNNTGLPYESGTISISGVNGQAYSLQNAKADQIYSDYENADRSTENGWYQPQFKYSADLGGQYIAEGGDEHCYREGDTIKVMFLSGDIKELCISTLVNIAKYSTQDLGLVITCKDENGNAIPVTDGKIALSAAGEYTVTYTVTDTLFYDKDGKNATQTLQYAWDVSISVSLKDKSIPNAYFEFDSSKQIMGYGTKSGLEGLGKSNFQYIPFLAGLKIYDYNGQTPYLRFDGNEDFAKIAKVELTCENGNAYIALILTDGGVINVEFGGRAESGSSTKTGTIKTSNNTVYYLTDGDTSATTTTWKISSYAFIGNNGVEIVDEKQVFSNCEKGTLPSSGFSTTIKYTVTYDANGGNCGQTTGYATSASAAVTLPTPTRSGYILAGWYTAANGGTRVGGAGELYTPSANITLYAQWGKPCTVTYNANGGSCGTASEKYSGTALTLPTATRDGYWFIGWHDAAEGGNKIGEAGATYNPTGEITLYAHWQEQVEYTVTYNANGGTCGTASATYQGTALTLPTPTRTGYTFNGWYTAASGDTKAGDAGASYTPSANITLYAQWEKIAYTITVTTSNATVSGVTNGQTAYYGDTITFTVTYLKNSNKSTTVTDANGNTVDTTGSYTFTMPAGNVTITASSSDACVTPDTLVTLADGSHKRVDELTNADQILGWNLYEGEYQASVPAYIIYHGDAYYRVITLNFSDGTTIKIIGEHGFFDVTTRQYEFLDESNVSSYVGHQFAKQDGDSHKYVTLESYSICEEYTGAYSIASLTCNNAITNDMITLTPVNGFEDSERFFNFLELGEGLKYDEEAMQKDIETYGLFTYEDLSDYLTEEEFAFVQAMNGHYCKIAIGKGLYTLEEFLGTLAHEDVVN